MKHDCRKINGKTCEFLKPLGEKTMKTNYHSYLCENLNVIIWPEFLHEFKPNEKLIGIAPNFSCIQMSRLRKLKKADTMAFTLSKNKSKHWNNKKIVDL